MFVNPVGAMIDVSLALLKLVWADKEVFLALLLLSLISLHTFPFARGERCGRIVFGEKK